MWRTESSRKKPAMGPAYCFDKQKAKCRFIGRFDSRSGAGAPWLPPGGSCPSAHTGADEECGRKSADLQNDTDLLPVFISESIVLNRSDISIVQTGCRPRSSSGPAGHLPPGGRYGGCTANLPIKRKLMHSKNETERVRAVAKRIVLCTQWLRALAR